MNLDHFQLFRSRYDGMSSDELAKLDGERGDLVEEARAALDEVISQREINPKEIRDEIVAASIPETNPETGAASEKREGGSLWILIVVSVLASAANFARSSEEFYESLAAALTQGAILTAFAWTFVKIRDKLRKQKHQHSSRGSIR